MHSTDIIGYGFDGAMYCTEHGAPLDTGEDDGAWPYFADGENDILSTCDHGHPFCGNCGAIDWFEVTERPSGAREWKCANCFARVRFLKDGRGFERWGFGDGRWHYIEGTG